MNPEQAQYGSQIPHRGGAEHLHHVGSLPFTGTDLFLAAGVALLMVGVGLWLFRLLDRVFDD